MVNLKKTSIVKPAESTPNQIMSVSDCDQIKPLTHSPVIYFYKPTTEPIENAFRILKDSLGKALVKFYPVAGRLHSIGGGRVEIHCNSMGALLVEAESHLKIEDFGDFRPTPEVSALFPSVDFSKTPVEEVPLLLVQLTMFACGGFSLGLKLSHIIMDGYSASDFISEWVKMARDEKSVGLPFLDRTVLQPKEPLAAQPKSRYTQLDPPHLLTGQSDNVEERKEPTTVTMLKLHPVQIDKRKTKVNIEKRDVGKLRSSRAFSRFEALAAHIWRCASKARRHRSEQETMCYITVDFRNRLKPPLPPRYFRNAVMLVPAIARSGDVASKPLGYVSGKIRGAIESVTDGYVSSYLLRIRNLLDVSVHRHSHLVGVSHGAFFGNPNLAITSRIGVPLDGADFGWGRETFMGPGTVPFDGRAFVIPSSEGDGSICVPLCLQVEHFDAFQKYLFLILLKINVQ